MHGPSCSRGTKILRPENHASNPNCPLFSSSQADKIAKSQILAVFVCSSSVKIFRQRRKQKLFCGCSQRKKLASSLGLKISNPRSALNQFTLLVKKRMSTPMWMASQNVTRIYGARNKFQSQRWSDEAIRLRQDLPLEAILVIFGRRALIFFCLKALGKNEKWHHFCAHAQWWSPWRRKNVEKGHLAPSNLTFLILTIDRNGFRRMKEEGLVYKILPQIF